MFTGIVEAKGKVLKTAHRGQGKSLTLQIPWNLTEIRLGDSINVSGACLTVVEKLGKAIVVDVSAETLQRTTLGTIREGEDVNLERALKLSDRVGGHIVTGHIDGTASIVERRQEKDFLVLAIRLPRSVVPYVVEKGSIAVDGISLTVNECQAGKIGLTLIPFTLKETTLFGKKVGDQVNVEADILAKYVEGLMSRKEGRVTLSFLRDHGFVKEE